MLPEPDAKVHESIAKQVEKEEGDKNRSLTPIYLQLLLLCNTKVKSDLIIKDSPWDMSREKLSGLECWVIFRGRIWEEHS